MPLDPRPHIIIDANVLAADFFLRTNASRLILHEAGRGRVRFIVPLITFLEVVNKYAEAVKQELSKFDRCWRGLERLDIAPDHGPQMPSVDQTRQSYEESLRSLLAASGAELVPLPEVPHERLIKRILARRAPSNINNESYRDALLWETVLSILSTEAGNVCLVSNDQDFREGKTAGLANDLKTELVDADIDMRRSP